MRKPSYRYLMYWHDPKDRKAGYDCCIVDSEDKNDIGFYRLVCKIKCYAGGIIIGFNQCDNHYSPDTTDHRNITYITRAAFWKVIGQDLKKWGKV